MDSTFAHSPPLSFEYFRLSVRYLYTLFFLLDISLCCVSPSLHGESSACYVHVVFPLFFTAGAVWTVYQKRKTTFRERYAEEHKKIREKSKNLCIYVYKLGWKLQYLYWTKSWKHTNVSLMWLHFGKCDYCSPQCSQLRSIIWLREILLYICSYFVIRDAFGNSKHFGHFDLSLFPCGNNPLFVYGYFRHKVSAPYRDWMWSAKWGAWRNQ